MIIADLIFVFVLLLGFGAGAVIIDASYLYVIESEGGK